MCIAHAIAKSQIKKYGLYTPMLTPNNPWELVSMKFM